MTWTSEVGSPLGRREMADVAVQRISKWCPFKKVSHFTRYVCMMLKCCSRQERATSPTESVLSVISHTWHLCHKPIPGARELVVHRAAMPTHRTSAPNQPNAYDDPHVNGSVNGRRDIFPAPPSSSVSHPSLSMPYAPNVTLL